MSKYLMDKFVGRFRVLCELDQSTNDFVRDVDGNLDSDYDDFYIPCGTKMKIKHGVGSMLVLYIQGNGKSHNIINQYYEAAFGKPSKNYNIAAKKLIEEGYATNIEFLDGEGLIEFDAQYIDLLEPIVKPRTSGAKISPFSTRNLPKAAYVIPQADLDKYKKAKEGIEPLRLGKINAEFASKHIKDDYNSKMRKEMLKPINYFHKHGLWDKYCEYLIGVER